MTKAAKCVYWVAVALVLCLVMAIVGLVPAKAHAADTTSLQAGSVATKTVQTQKVTAANTNPYKDVIKGKTVDKKGYNAVKYVKTHKGYNGVITGKRFYPAKRFTQAQFTKILRNLYGNKVALSKSKTAVTGKWACAELQKVAKTVFGVKIKWKSGNGSAKLTRTGCSNYIRSFATWENGLFAPKQ